MNSISRVYKVKSYKNTKSMNQILVVPLASHMALQISSLILDMLVKFGDNMSPIGSGFMCLRLDV